MRQTDQIDNSYALHNAVLVRKLDTAKQKEGTVNPPTKLQADPANELTNPSIASILTPLANCNTEFTDKGTSAKFSFCNVEQNMSEEYFRLKPVDTIAVCAPPESFSWTLVFMQSPTAAPRTAPRRPSPTRYRIAAGRRTPQSGRCQAPAAPWRSPPRREYTAA